MNNKVKKEDTHNFKEDKAIIKIDYNIEELNRSSENQNIKFINSINQ